MYIIDCQNCREANQINDKMENKTIRCHICQKIIQIGEVKKEVITNINKIDDHEIRIVELEEQENEIILPHHIFCTCNICTKDCITQCIILAIVVIVGIIVVQGCL